MHGSETSGNGSSHTGEFSTSIDTSGALSFTEVEIVSKSAAGSEFLVGANEERLLRRDKPDRDLVDET